MSDLSFSITLDKKSLGRINFFVNSYPKTVETIVRKTADWSYKNIVKLTPVRFGAARRSWVLRKVAPLVYGIVSAVGAGRKYTKYLETGTGLYVPGGKRITGIHGKVLVFPVLSGGQVRWIHTKSTKGMPGHFMVQRTKRDALPFMAGKLKIAIKNLLKSKKGEE